ncbi:MAG: M24 family metallopeptidase [Spirochaetales bacterium]|nr:M24 family metallopeptidase [Spirochaetales bacterium]
MKPDIPHIQKAIREENFDGWLFYNFNHLDPVSDDLLCVKSGMTNSRRWVYVIPSEGDPVAVCHRIETDILSHLPGTKLFYSGRDEFSKLLSRFSGMRLAAQFSRDIPAISFLDAGMYQLCVSLGINLDSSAGVLQRQSGVLSTDDLASHSRAAYHLYEIISNTWNRLRSMKELPSEQEVMSWILKEFTRRNLRTVHVPIVASGKNSANPHFDTSGSTKLIGLNEVLQLDIWAAEQDGVWADISWIGFTGSEVPAQAASVFHAAIGARDAGIAFIREGLEEKRKISGAEVDVRVRDYIREKGYEHGILHRTGHGIDRVLHGWGANIDSVEFPDHRLLLEGSCFSIEPGIYLQEFGMRTEINCIIQSGRAIVTGPSLQQDILIF